LTLATAVANIDTKAAHTLALKTKCEPPPFTSNIIMPPICSDYLDWRSQLFTFGAENSSPKYWFGEFVDFCWNDENSGEPHSETGVVVGVAWNNADREWEYIVTWLSSTAYPEGNYPISDMNFVAEEILCRP